MGGWPEDTEGKSGAQGGREEVDDPHPKEESETWKGWWDLGSKEEEKEEGELSSFPRLRGGNGLRPRNISLPSSALSSRTSFCRSHG